MGCSLILSQNMYVEQISKNRAESGQIPEGQLWRPVRPLSSFPSKTSQRTIDDPYDLAIARLMIPSHKTIRFSYGRACRLRQAVEVQRTAKYSGWDESPDDATCRQRLRKGSHSCHNRGADTWQLLKTCLCSIYSGPQFWIKLV